ncbi:MAG: peptidase and subtilisin kexin sedolisin, partial [Bacteroidetes bacterium]|nr:peptidase and subtilisin kexin sedolisin [Bacteroidota bacterium]
MTRLLAFACCMLIFVSWASEAGVRGLKRSGPADGTVPGVVIVKFKPGVTPMAGALGKGSGALGGMLAQHGVMALTRTFPGARPPEVGLSAGSRMDLSRIYYATVKKESDVREIAGRLSRLPQVEYAEPKYFQHLRESPNDALFSSNQAVYFSRLEALSGWGFAKGSQNVTIAVVDGGTYWEHEDLVGNLWVNAAEDLNNNGSFEKGAAPVGDEDGVDQDGDGRVDDVAGWNFTNNTNDARGLSTTPQSRAHGTATASHFGAVTNNTVGMAGSSWNCRMMPVCVASATADSRIEYGYEGIHYAFT